jgi:hypothetical protein
VHVLPMSLDGASRSSLQLICLLRAGKRGRLGGDADVLKQLRAAGRDGQRLYIFLLREVNKAIPLPRPIPLYIFFLR